MYAYLCFFGGVGADFFLAAPVRRFTELSFFWGGMFLISRRGAEAILPHCAMRVSPDAYKKTALQKLNEKTFGVQSVLSGPFRDWPPD